MNSNKSKSWGTRGYPEFLPHQAGPLGSEVFPLPCRFDAVVETRGSLQRMDEALSPPLSQLEASRVTERDTWELFSFPELYTW